MGELVGERREYDERLTMFLLRARRRQRFGKWIDRLLQPDPHGEGEPIWRLFGDLDRIDVTAPMENGYQEEGDAE